MVGWGPTFLLLLLLLTAVLSLSCALEVAQRGLRMPMPAAAIVDVGGVMAKAGTTRPRAFAKAAPL